MDNLRINGVAIIWILIILWSSQQSIDFTNYQAAYYIDETVFTRRQLP
jgi:hypothetical protein